MIKRMIREGQIDSESKGVVAEYAISLGLLEMALTSRGTANESKLRASTMDDTSIASDWMSKGQRDARNSLAQRAAARRLAAMAAGEGGGGGTMRGLGDVPGLVSQRGGEENDDRSSYTGSSYTGTTIEEEEEEEEEEGPGRAGHGHGVAPLSSASSPKSPSKKGWLGGFFSSRKTTRAQEEGERTSRGEGTARGIEATTQAGGSLGAAGEKKKKHHRRHRRRRRSAGKAPDNTPANGEASAKSAPEGGGLYTPSFMMPLFSKIRQRAAEEAARAAGSDPRLDKWRTRWDEKWVEGGAMPSDRHASAHHLFEGNARSMMRSSTLSSMSASQVSAPKDTWGMVRDRIGEISQMV